jgi:hypothetical protein
MLEARELVAAPRDQSGFGRARVMPPLVRLRCHDAAGADDCLPTWSFRTPNRQPSETTIRLDVPPSCFCERREPMSQMGPIADIPLKAQALAAAIPG